MSKVQKGIMTEKQIQRKKYYHTHRKEALEYNKEYNKNYFKLHPWIRHFYGAKERCLPTKAYGKKGRKCLITLEELKFLWFRDKAFLLKKPSVDRIDNNGNYELSNCRFIEQSLNASLGSKFTPRPVGEKNPCSKLTEKDVLAIKKYFNTNLKGYKELAKLYNVSYTTILNIVHNKKWKYLNIKEAQ